MKKYIFLVLFAAIAAIGCSHKDILIQKNIEHAENQLSMLIPACDTENGLKIPSTFRDGKVIFTHKKDWVSGFYAGTLWYMYELTGEEEYALQAQKHTEHLHDIQYLTSHHDIGFMIGNSYGNGLRLKYIEGYDTVLVNAARSLATRYRPAAGVIQSWNISGKNWQSKRGWKCPVIIDNLMNLELLFKASLISKDNSFRDIAVSHADKTLINHYRKDYSTYHVVDYDDQTGEIRNRCTAQGIADESSWARGQAWSLYGLAILYRYTEDDRYLQMAKNVAEYLYVKEENMPEDLIPLWDFHAVEYAENSPFFQPYTTQRDVSSAAICASALYEIHWHTKDAFYKKTADRILESLSSAPYISEPGTNGGFILQHSVGSIPHGGNIDVPLNYADYYFLEALLRKSKIEDGVAPISL